VSDPTQGYSFDDEMFTQSSHSFHVQPSTAPNVTPDAAGHFAQTAGFDLIVPIFLDSAGTNAIILPLRQARLSGTLSSNGDCIGTYNAAGLDPTNSCQPDITHPQFLDAGKIDGFMTLEDADTVLVSPIAETLCVLLSGDAAMYGTTMGAITVCKRDASNKILYQGNWCAATNAAATSACADSVSFAANYAASSVQINN
jgi:hypothetical protein